MRARHRYEEQKQRLLSYRPETNKGKKYKRHKERGPNLTPSGLAAAIKGSLGIFARIARKLGVRSQAVRLAIYRPGFEEALQAFREETDGMLDQAVSTVSEMMSQRDEFKTALSAAKFVLDRRGKDKGWRSEVTIQGGETPLRVENSHSVNFDVMDLPLEVRRQVLERIEAQETPPEKRPVLKVKRII